MLYVYRGAKLFVSMVTNKCGILNTSLFNSSYWDGRSFDVFTLFDTKLFEITFFWLHMTLSLHEAGVGFFAHYLPGEMA